MLLLLSLSLARAGEAALLVCDSPEACEADLAYVESVGAAGGRALSTLDSLLVQDSDGWADGSDQDDRLSHALGEAGAAARAGEWRAVAQATAAAEDALRRWPGAVDEATLFSLLVLRGAAELHRGAEGAATLSLQQAAAVVDGRAPPLPLPDPALEAAWSSALRSLAAGGRGTLVLAQVPDGAFLSVDGRRLPPGSVEVALLPGAHRLTARLPGGLRTWAAEVPVLAERESRVLLDLDGLPTAEGAWRALVGAFDSHAAPDPILDLLVDWCERRGLQSLRLLRVEPRDGLRPLPALTIGPAPATRPAAAAGALLDTGDLLPATAEDTILAEHEAKREATLPPRGQRVRLVTFDPALRRFTESPAAEPTAALAPSDRLSAGLSVGYTGMVDRRHGAVDLVIGGPAGPITLEGKLGLVRADLPYNLYPDWSDRQLYHLSLGARWSWVEADLRPVLGGAVEAFVPVSLGAALSAGAEARFGDWLTALDLSGGLQDEGPTTGASLRLQRRY